MKESYREELASRSGLDPYAGDGDVAGVASVRGNAGQTLSSDIRTFRSVGVPSSPLASPRQVVVATAALTILIITSSLDSQVVP